MGSKPELRTTAVRCVAKRERESRRPHALKSLNIPFEGDGEKFRNTHGITAVFRLFSAVKDEQLVLRVVALSSPWFSPLMRVYVACLPFQRDANVLKNEAASASDIRHTRYTQIASPPESGSAERSQVLKSPHEVSELPSQQFMYVSTLHRQPGKLIRFIFLLQNSARLLVLLSRNQQHPAASIQAKNKSEKRKTTYLLED